MERDRPSHVKRYMVALGAPAITRWMNDQAHQDLARLLDLVKFIQRRYKRDTDFTEFVAEVGDSLSDFVKREL